MSGHPVSAEPRVLLEFEVDGKAMEIVEQGDRRFLVSDGIAGWNDDPSGLYSSEWSRAVFAVYDAMRAREVRE